MEDKKEDNMAKAVEQQIGKTKKPALTEEQKIMKRIQKKSAGKKMFKIFGILFVLVLVV